MLDWLRYISVCFFKNKIAKEGSKRSFVNVFFALFIEVFFITSFISMSFAIALPSHYNNASSFKEFVYETFANDDASLRIKLEIDETRSEKNTKFLKATNYDGSAAYIDTYRNKEDKNKYSKNGYNLIVDTRNSETTLVRVYFDENETYVVTDEVISAKGYVTEYNVVKYFDDKCASLQDSDELKTSWNDIKALDNNSDEFYSKAYTLYCEDYFKLSGCPTILNYYQYTYAVLTEDGNDYMYKDTMIITDYWTLISFTNDRGVNETFDGFYSGLDDNWYTYIIENANDTTKIKTRMDGFIKSAYSSVFAIKFIYSVMSATQFQLYVIVTLIALTFIVYLVSKTKKRNYGDNFFEVTKILSGFLLTSSIIAVILSIPVSLFNNNTATYTITCFGMLAIFAVRCILYVIIEEITISKGSNLDEELEHANGLVTK